MTISKKKLLAQIASVRPVGSLIRQALPDTSQVVRVLAYHRILPPIKDSEYLFDADLISAYADNFDWQMAHIARHYQPINYSRLRDAVCTGVPLPKNSVLVTFDDGFIDNYTIAFPILKKHQIQALFFVSTDYVGSSELFWFDEVMHRLKVNASGTVSLPQTFEKIVLDGKSVEQRQQFAHEILKQLKLVPNEARLAYLQQLSQTLPVTAPEESKRLNYAMSAGQLKEMASQGMYFGAHSRSHPILSRLESRSVLDEEIAGSRRELEKILGSEVTSIAYPVGGKRAISPDVLDSVSQAGYELAFTYESGLVNPRSCEKHQLRRLRIERDTTRADFSALLALPKIFM